VKDGDTVVMSATPIPGNEELVSRTVDNLFKLGAEVIYDAGVRPHVSGHASQEELKLLLNILRPKYFIPVHGEYRMLVRHARIAIDLGVAPGNAFVITNGDSLEIDEHGARLIQRIDQDVKALRLVALLRRQARDALDDNSRETFGDRQVVGGRQRPRAQLLEREPGDVAAGARHNERSRQDRQRHAADRGVVGQIGEGGFERVRDSVVHRRSRSLSGRSPPVPGSRRPPPIPG